MTPVTETLARFVVETKFEDLPAATVEAAKFCFLDWLGSAYAGSAAVPTRILLETVEGLGGVPQATLIPNGERTSCLYAALVNSASSHFVEMDDVARACIYHPAAAVIPAALAVAERDKASGAELLRAIVLGYEASMRIGEAVSPSHYHYWHTTGTVGTFGAAVAAGAILGLDVGRMVWALGSAGTQASGLWEFLVDGAMSKQLHPAKAAMNGLLAALLAQKGFTAATRILEGEKGFCRATAPEFDLSRITQGLRPGMTDYRIQQVSFKIHASCRHTHPAIDATLDLVKTHNLAPQDIEEIRVKVYTGAMDLLGKIEATNPFAAKFNMPYCLATAVVNREVGLDMFSEARLWDKDIRQLMEKVSMEVDPNLDRLYPAKWTSIVEIGTRRGELLESRVECPKGDPENPLSPDELKVKFAALASPFLSTKEIGRYIDRVSHLDEIANVADFF